MIVHHPTIPGLSREVPDERAAGWLEQGWVTDEAAPAVPSDEPCPTCGATGEDPCVTPSGNETGRHARRT